MTRAERIKAIRERTALSMRLMEHGDYASWEDLVWLLAELDAADKRVAELEEQAEQGREMLDRALEGDE